MALAAMDEHTSQGEEKGHRHSRSHHPRYIFQVSRSGGRPVIRVLDTHTESVFREVSAADFVRFAKNHRDVAQFLLKGGLVPGESPA
jgi:uncharacterized FlaG/YvyC family protein